MNADPTRLVALEEPPALRELPMWARVAHWAIIINLSMQMLYIGFQVFVVLQPEGHIGPMFGAALSIPYEQMVVRRLYAIEGWMAFLGLAFYLALTEIVPRRRA